MCLDAQCAFRHFAPEVAVNVMDAKQPCTAFLWSQKLLPGLGTTDSRD